MTPKQRSNCMSRVRGKNTTPEIILRKQLWAAGFRYSLHSPLPGKPDIVLPKYKCAIFVHGCFWHQHEGCSKSRMPKTNIEFWQDKIVANVLRDKCNQVDLAKIGWQVLVVWECDIKNDVCDVVNRVVDGLQANCAEKLKPFPCP